jgi:hypothetical protein
VPLSESSFHLYLSSYYTNQSVYELSADTLQLADSLLTISPITEVIPTGGELVCLSGYHLRSSVSFVKEHVPCETMPVRDIPGVKRVCSVRKVVDLYVFISTEDSTQVLVPVKPGQFEKAER